MLNGCGCRRYLTLKPEQVNAFFKLMGERYGKKTTIITSNLDYHEWYDLFQTTSSSPSILKSLPIDRAYRLTVSLDEQKRVSSGGHQGTAKWYWEKPDKMLNILV